MKQYVGFSRDHSGSMASLRQAAMRDFNENVAAIKSAAEKNDIDTVVSVASCGVNSGEVRVDVANSSLTRLKPLTQYPTEGNTPLFDSIGVLINLMENVPDADNKDVSFLVIAITDGEENASKNWDGARLGKAIRRLQATDRWTFVFRVPRGYGRALERLGIPAGNIQEWEQTEQGLRESSIHTQSAVSNYFVGRAAGVRSTNCFYADLSNVSTRDVKATMTNISAEVRIAPVRSESAIREFVESRFRTTYAPGCAFYQLTKPETVQSYKLIVIRDQNTGAVYAGQSARDLLNIPSGGGSIRLVPGDHSHYDIYVQSTSVNRKLMAGTNLLYWENAARSR